jgi:rhodanese-related sulfurtransferase
MVEGRYGQRQTLTAALSFQPGRRATWRREIDMSATELAVPNVYQATVPEPDPKTPQVSTEEVRRILKDGSAILLDSRKRAEFDAGHIAGATNVTLQPGAAPEEYLAAVERLVGGNKEQPLVVYCNGQYCRQGRQLSANLAESGFTNVRRYQLGIQVWRALSLPVEIELEGIVRIFDVDRTVIYFDARSPQEFAQGSIPRAHNVPADETDTTGLGQAPMPRNDFNTRIVVFGRDGAQPASLPTSSAEHRSRMCRTLPAHSRCSPPRSRPSNSREQVTHETAQPHRRHLLASRQRYGSRSAGDAAEDRIQDQQGKRLDAAGKLSRPARGGPARRRGLGV